jgi:hypothetical protein
MKKKDDLIRHLKEDHARDHIVSKAEGGTRLAKPSELRNLYATGWTVAVLVERHAMLHEMREERGDVQPDTPEL